MKNGNLTLTTIFLTLGFLALSPIAQAVVPAPDGGYPGGNTAEGQNALLSLVTGTYNTAVGLFSLEINSIGSFNTALGAGALLANTADQNTGIGAGALLNSTTGSYNTANGTFALFNNIDGVENTATGASALFSNTSGEENTGDGGNALLHNVDGIGNTAAGFDALYNNIHGSANTGIGRSALGNTIADGNTAVGFSALINNITGSNNIALGFGAGSNVVTASDTICIGIVGVDVTDGCYMGHVFEEPLDPDNLAMAIDVHGKVGTLPSSRRFKDDIKPMDKTSEAILALKPVTFRYKNDAKRRPRFGLIAEEVAEVDPNLVARDKEGKPYSVRYEQINAMLLNEFLKEHRQVENQERQIHEQQATIIELMSTVVQDEKSFQSRFAEQEKHIETLASNLRRASSQVKMREPAAKVMVANP